LRRVGRMALLKPIPVQKKGMSKTTRRASSTTSAAKGRLGTTWGHC